jgi:hypothetical protein
MLVAGSFYVTLQILDYWETPSGPPSEISVQSATYGENCPGVQAGNATASVRSECDRRSSCSYQVTLTKVGGDPSGGCAKAFSVVYACSGSVTTKRSAMPGEADEKFVRLSCP